MAALPDDWGYKLGQAFLTAAVSCGATCDRRFVSDGGNIEGPPPSGGCSCQLIAVVTEGWEPTGTKCGTRMVAEVRLVLHLCTVVAGQDEIPDPVKVGTQAMANSATRWAMMRGLRDAWTHGRLTWEQPEDQFLPECTSIVPGPWRLVRSTGGIARWEAVWRYQQPI